MSAYAESLTPFANSIRQSLEKFPQAEIFQDIYRVIIETQNEVGATEMPSAENERRGRCTSAPKAVRTRVQAAADLGVLQSLAAAHHDAVQRSHHTGSLKI